MSSVVLDRLRSVALTLSEPERAELAHALVTSLDGPRILIRRIHGTVKLCGVEAKLIPEQPN